MNELQTAYEILLHGSKRSETTFTLNSIQTLEFVSKLDGLFHQLMTAEPMPIPSSTTASNIIASLQHQINQASLLLL